MRNAGAAAPARRDRSIGRQLAVVVTLVLVGLSGHVGYYEWAYRGLSRSLDADLGTWRRLRWERPVLRGTPGDGNAAQEEFAALAGFAALPDPVREALADQVRYGKPLGKDQLALLQERGPALDHLRDATTHTFARTELVPERGLAMRVPDYPRMVDASLLLLARAETAPPDECLRIANDVIRLGQDLVPGGPLEAASVSMRLTSLAAPVIARCATKADLTTLRRSAHELHTLATHAPPTGATIELQDIVTAMKLRKLATLADKPDASAVLAALLDRPRLLGAWALYTDPTRFRQLVPSHYPDAIDDWKREQDARARMQTQMPMVANDSAGILDFLYDDMRGQAILRDLTVGVATLADRAYRGKLPTDAVGAREPELCDPFFGKPLGYRIGSDGTEFVVWSVGEDLHDGNGSDEWADAAPLDVTVHFPVVGAVGMPVVAKEEGRSKRGP